MIGNRILSATSTFIDPRIGKTNLIIDQTVYPFSYSVTVGTNILGPDGNYSGIRLTGVASNCGVTLGSYPSGYVTLTNGQIYTVSMYVRTPSNQGIYYYVGNQSAAGWASQGVIGGAYSSWTLIEHSSMVTLTQPYIFWIGLYSTWTTGEWVEFARPMIYAGNKVT